MSLLAQHGFGKGSKIDTAMEARVLDGVIFSPRHESPENLAGCLSRISDTYPSSTRLVDPQFYASTVAPAKLGRLDEYAWFRAGLGLGDFLSARKVESYARSVLEFQQKLAVSALVSPTLRVSGLRDRVSQIALQLADASCRWHEGTHGAPPLLISLVLDEQALRSEEELGDFIDTITLLECDGFYLIPFRAAETYSSLFDPEALAGLMYLVYVLGTLNEMQVVCGYSDLWGGMLRAVGAGHVASGWFQSLRHFTFRPFKPSTGGRQPRERYTSLPLLDSILLTDLDKIYENGLITQVLTGTEQDARFLDRSPLMVKWGQEDNVLHHWKSLRKFFDQVSGGTVQKNLRAVERRLDRAEAVFGETQAVGVEYEPPAGEHVAQWREAIDIFRRRTDLSAND